MLPSLTALNPTLPAVSAAEDDLYIKFDCHAMMQRLLEKQGLGPEAVRTLLKAHVHFDYFIDDSPPQYRNKEEALKLYYAVVGAYAEASASLDRFVQIADHGADTHCISIVVEKMEMCLSNLLALDIRLEHALKRVNYMPEEYESDRERRDKQKKQAKQEEERSGGAPQGTGKMQPFKPYHQLATFAPSKDDTLNTLGFFFDEPAQPEKSQPTSPSTTRRPTTFRTPTSATTCTSATR